MSDEGTLNQIRDNVSSLSTTMTSFLSAQTVLNESQKLINETNTSTLNKISESMTKSDAMQVELNGQSQRITEQALRQAATDDKISSLVEQVAVTTVLTGQTQDLKKTWSKAAVGVFFMFLASLGTMVYGTVAKQEASENSSAQLQAVLTELLARKE